VVFPIPHAPPLKVTSTRAVFAKRV